MVTFFFSLIARKRVQSLNGAFSVLGNSNVLFREQIKQADLQI
jgi:hypothetical protein